MCSFPRSSQEECNGLVFFGVFFFLIFYEFYEITDFLKKIKNEKKGSRSCASPASAQDMDGLGPVEQSPSWNREFVSMKHDRTSMLVPLECCSRTSGPKNKMKLLLT